MKVAVKDLRELALSAAAGAGQLLTEYRSRGLTIRSKSSHTDPVSEAKPEIWTNWADFISKANGLGTAAAAVDTASLEGIKAGMGGIGGACKACHETYRAED